MCRKLLRRPFLSVIILLNLLVLLYLLYNSNSVEEEFFEQNFLAVGDGAAANLSPHVCNLPIDVSPYDATVTGFLETFPRQVECSGAAAFKPLTYIDENLGLLKQNATTYQCEYRFVEKFAQDDSEIKYGEFKVLDPVHGQPLQHVENYVDVKCGSYENVHFWFNASAAGIEPQSGASADTKPSVIFLVIESLSRLNYLRYLNQTRIALENHLGNTFYLDGLNKMADNSFPNMVPLLTGKRLYKGELTGNENYGPYDDWPLIWNNFSKAGYLTALVEDYPKFTLFNYQSNGFTRAKPTDFYPRPYWMHLFRDVPAFMLKVFPFNISPCYKDRVPKVDLFLSQVQQMLEQSARAHLPLFAFTFYIELTHNNFNKAQTIDSHIAKFIANSAAHLNDSVLIVMGDHGNRFGSILQTTIGRIEERMPLFAVHLPHRLTARYPHLAANLQTNRRRLSSWLDVNLMLQDILNENYSALPSLVHKPSQHKRAYSPWREEIPSDRTCTTALIDDLYCACDRRLTLDHTENELAKLASHALLKHLNAVLGANERCEQLVLKEILRAELIFPSDSTAQAKGYRQKIEVTIEVSPSKAIFRSRLYRSAYQLEWLVDENQVTRINEYGDQPWCISQRDLKPFCFCATARANHTQLETGNSKAHSP